MKGQINELYFRVRTVILEVLYRLVPVMIWVDFSTSLGIVNIKIKFILYFISKIESLFHCIKRN